MPNNMKNNKLGQIVNTRFPLVLGGYDAIKSIVCDYLLMKDKLVDGAKIVVCGDTFRQTKMICEQLISIQHDWRVVRATDNIQIQTESNTIVFMPIGSGGRVNGLRADIFVYVASIFQKVLFDMLCCGFSACADSPVLGRTSTPITIMLAGVPNDEHISEHIKHYEQIVESQGDEMVLKHIFPSIPDGFDWTQYDIIKV